MRGSGWIGLCRSSFGSSYSDFLALFCLSASCFSAGIIGHGSVASSCSRGFFHVFSSTAWSFTLLSGVLSSGRVSLRTLLCYEELAPKISFASIRLCVLGHTESGKPARHIRGVCCAGMVSYERLLVLVLLLAAGWRLDTHGGGSSYHYDRHLEIRRQLGQA